MAQKKAIIGTLAFILVAFLMVGYFALASELGGKDDPLVTLGYLSALEPELKKKIDVMVDEEVKAQSEKIDSTYNTARQSLLDLVSQAGGTAGLSEDDAFISKVADTVIAKMGSSDLPAGTLPSTFAKVEVAANKTVTVKMGGMLFLRLGNATCSASGSPGLIDLTTGAELANGSALEKNHLYTVTVDSSSRGFKTGESGATVFILGSYNVE